MSDSEYGICKVCKKQGPLARTFFYYKIKCECCSPNHFVSVWHCPDCIPVEPTTTIIHIKTDDLKKVVGI